MREEIELLRGSERIALTLRGLFCRYGYEAYKMSRFEQYDLYLRNKDYLSSDRMIVFTDLSGELMALKPDVTISIIKNTSVEPGTVRKVHYTEHVFRADTKSNGFREIEQTGLECIGDMDCYHVCEVVLLAAKSLSLMGRDYILDVSHLGLVSGVFAASGVPEKQYTDVLHLIRDKNLAELSRLCQAYELPVALLSELISTYGEMDEVIRCFTPLCQNDEMCSALSELRRISEVLKDTGLSEHVRIDFSVVNDMRYYNGVTFRGFLSGLPTSVLSGGQYDSLMRKMGRKQSAIGFAVYLDKLEFLDVSTREYDQDVLLLYPKDADERAVSKAVEALTAEGRSVTAQSTRPKKLKCREVVPLETWRNHHA